MLDEESVMTFTASVHCTVVLVTGDGGDGGDVTQVLLTRCQNKLAPPSHL